MVAKSSPTLVAPKSSTNKASAPPRKAAKTLAGTPTADDSNRRATIALYETAIKLLQSGKYEKAHEAFNNMLAVAPHDLADRIRMYIAACVAQISKGTTDFCSHEERYDYAISLLNHGHYEDAREHFDHILLHEKSKDYAFYGLALLCSMTGDTDKCIEHLTEAIRLNPQYRLQARNDSDFSGVADDPRFTDLLYPES